MRKYYLGIFVVFVALFYAEISMGASITLCDETYELKVSGFSKKKMSFIDKYGDEVYIYILTDSFINQIDSRAKDKTFPTYHIYVKDNKTYGIARNDIFSFLDNKLAQCKYNYDFDSRKMMPFTTEYNYDYSNLHGVFIEGLGYLGDNESVGLYNLDFEIEEKQETEESNNTLDDKLINMVNNAYNKKSGFTVPEITEELEEAGYDSRLYDKDAFTEYVINALNLTLTNGINSVFVKPYSIQELQEDEEESGYSEYGYHIFSYTTPLMIAVYAGYNDIAIYLLEHGANPAYYNNGADALLFAVITNNKEMIYKLVEYGAPVILDRFYESDAIGYAELGQYVGIYMPFEDIIKEYLDEKEIEYLKSQAYK